MPAKTKKPTTKRTPKTAARSTSAKSKSPRRAATSRSTRGKSSMRKKFSRKRILGLRLHHVGGLALLVIGMAWGAMVLLTRPVQTTSAANCSINSKLVNSCRPWIGAASSSYGASGLKGQIVNFESRAKRQVDVVHSYHKPTQTSLSGDERYFIGRPGTYLYMNWKPDTYWANAGGSKASVNASIDKMAESLKSVAPKKIFLTVYHEPENDLSGGSKCSRYVGNKGTPAQYRAMWKNVRKRFDAKGVNNVVWTMNYMGWQGWDCAVKDLWPGNNLVDWVTWDPYTNDKGTFSGDMSRFYNYLSKNSDSSHNFASKPWGIGEMGYEGHDQDKAYKYYDDMAIAVKQNKFPNLKMYLFFDMNGTAFGGGADWDSRIGYARNKTADPTEQKHFNEMFKTVVATDVPTAPQEPTNTSPAPTITVRAPANNSTVAGKVRVGGKVSDAGKVKLVTMRVDGKWIATDQASPYSFTLDTRKLKDGKHSLLLRILDTQNRRIDSKPIVIKVDNIR